jgi:chemotaxis protein methyltransferase WspC
VTPGVIENVVRERLGLDPSSLGRNVLERAVESRMHARGLKDPALYAAQLITESAERDSLACELAVTETWFFRGGRSLFDRLSGFIADRATNRVPGSAVRVLSVPCSTGEEPYSLAIALYERLLTSDDFIIDAVDVSERALAKAAMARYGSFAFREIGADVRPAYFRHVGDSWELLPHLRDTVRLLPANLTDPGFLAAERPYDLILCRNLFIYLTPDARLRAMANIDRLLAPEGRLCMTPAEADRLPPGRFIPDGLTEFGIYRRVEEGSDTHKALLRAAQKPPHLSGSAIPRLVAASPSTAPRPATATIPTPPRTLESARLLADAGRLEEAQAVCEQLLRARSSDVDALALLGVIHLAARREDDALTVFRKVLYLMPDHVEAMSHMIGLSERRGDKAHAAALRRRLARVKKENA